MVNLLFLTVDEMRGDCLGANRLNPDIRTPHLDALAARGVNFARHFTTFPKCVPARVSLTTGRYCHTGAFRDIFQHLPATEPDLLSRLLDRGYECALFGKNHCWENVFEATHTPPQLGAGQVGHRLAHHSWTGEFKAIYDDAKARLAPSPEMAAAARDERVKPFNTHWADEAYTAQAVHFLEHRDPTRPFYLHVNIESPHPSYALPPADDPFFHDPAAVTLFPGEEPTGAPLAIRAQREVRRAGVEDDAARRRVQAAYFSMIARVDAQVGRIVAALDRLDLAKDTVIVCLSDHGDFAGQYSLPEKWDTVFADCLLHVPCLLVAPSLPAGRTVESVTDHTDIAPTLIELLGLDPLPGMHGHPLLPAIEGRPVRDAVFADGGHEREMRARVSFPEGSSDKHLTYARYPDAMARAMGVRTATHKLVVRETGDHELYDLTSDRWELHNRYADPALRDVREDLKDRLLHWRLRMAPDRPFAPVVGV